VLSRHRSSGDLLPPSPPAEKATYLDLIRSRHTLHNALALSSFGPTSNAQHDQPYKSDADEQHYERDGVVFEPMPITGKHDVSSLFQMDCENRSAVAPEAQAVFCRRRDQPRRPPAKIRPGRPALGDGTASSEASQQKPSFDPRIAGLEEILRAPDCAFPKWILQASLWLSRRTFPS
jgi:hypothetical protein